MSSRTSHAAAALRNLPQPARTAAEGGRGRRRDVAHRAVIIGDNDTTVAVAEAMQANGFDVRAIRPPTVPPGTARLRVSVERERDADSLSGSGVADGRARIPRGRRKGMLRDLRHRH